MGSASSRPQPTSSLASAPNRAGSGFEKASSSSTPSSSATFSLPTGHHAADRLHRISAEASAGTTSRRGRPLSDVNDSLEKSSGRAYATVDLGAVKAWDADALAKPTSQLAAMTLHNGAINTSLRNRSSETSSQHVYSHTLKREQLCPYFYMSSRSHRLLSLSLSPLGPFPPPSRPRTARNQPTELGPLLAVCDYERECKQARVPLSGDQSCSVTNGCRSCASRSWRS